MTVRAITEDDLLAWAIAVRDHLSAEAAYRRRRGEGVHEIRKAIAEEALAQRGEDVVAHLRVRHREQTPAP